MAPYNDSALDEALETLRLTTKIQTNSRLDCDRCEGARKAIGKMDAQSPHLAKALESDLVLRL